MPINVTESENAIIDTADVLVKIRKKDRIPPPMQRYANINVYTKKTGDTNLDGELLTIANKNQHTAKIEDSSEIFFVGQIKVWNVDKLEQKHVDRMIAYGETLVVTSSKSEEIQKNSDNLDFKNLIVWLTETSQTTTMDDIAKMSNRGVFLDTEKNGKCLYAVSKLLQNPENLEFSTQITTSNITKGITDIGIAKQLDDAGMSYFFKANDLCWARGFWIAGQQARSIYADRSVMYDVKTDLTQMIQSGMNYNEETLNLLEARILQSLKLNPFVSMIVSIHIPKQKASNKVKGVISGITIKYVTSTEIRTVYIELGE